MRRFAVILLAIGLMTAAPAAWPEDDTPSRKREEREWTQLTETFAKAYVAKRFDEAARRAEDSLRLAERVFGPDHPLVATSLSNLAMALEATEDDSRLEALLRRALAIRERALGPTHPDVGKSLTNLGRLKHYQHRYAEAEPLYQRALAVQEAAEPVNEIAVANALHDLAVLYRDRQQYDKAAPHLKRELEIWERRFGSEHLLELPLLDLYAEILKRTGDSRKAEALESQAARIREQRDAALAKPK